MVAIIKRSNHLDAVAENLSEIRAEKDPMTNGNELVYQQSQLETKSWVQIDVKNPPLLDRPGVYKKSVRKGKLYQCIQVQRQPKSEEQLTGRPGFEKTGIQMNKEEEELTSENLDWINPEGRQYRNDLRTALTVLITKILKVVVVITFNHSIDNDTGKFKSVGCQANSTYFVNEDSGLQDYGISNG
ncbi:hypothetical protein Tco_1133838 [Tanacetum coccineum]